MRFDVVVPKYCVMRIKAHQSMRRCMYIADSEEEAKSWIDNNIEFGYTYFIERRDNK